MKQVLAPALITALWLSLLQTDIPVGQSFLPALGRFLHPMMGIWHNVKVKDTPSDFHGTIAGPVDIKFDDRLIPHIYAASTADALYAQGFMHAYHRLFSMDITARAAAGRLSEILGSRTLAYDRKQRERGFEHSARMKAKHWEKYSETRQLLQAYTAGVNAYIQSLEYKDWPVEYKLLSHAPSEWNHVQTALVATSMAISLCLGEDDLECTTARHALSPEDFAFLYPEENPAEEPIMGKLREWNFEPIVSPVDSGGSAVPETLHRTKADRSDRYLKGSNNWAVAPFKTKNGYAIVANDPHLNLTLPNIWYEMEIHTPDIDVHGMTLPGLPFVILGFTEGMAWGSTNSGQDVLDWYTIEWENNKRLAYKLDGQWVEANIELEEIRIKGDKPFIDSIRYTHWGPVTNTGDHRDLAMKWIGHVQNQGNDVDYLHRINQTNTLAEYREAVSSFLYPAQNKVFGSTAGDIAISIAGVIPLREDGQGEYVTDGTKSAHDWKTYIPFEKAPFSINPSSGFVASANQKPADTTYPYPQIGKRYFEDYRGRTLHYALDSSDQITVEDMKALQQNNYNLHAAEYLPVLLTLLQNKNCTKALEHPVFTILSQWNFEYHRDSISPVMFQIWYKLFESYSWEELDTLGLMRPEPWRMVDIAKQFPAHRYFDSKSTDTVVETAADIACLTFDIMIDSLDHLNKNKIETWGEYKRSFIPHLARFPHFGVDYIATSGGKYILNAMSASNGPSFRMVAEMREPIVAWINYPGGQSGNPASAHFNDFVKSFFEGAYFEVRMKKNPDWSASSSCKISPQ